MAYVLSLQPHSPLKRSFSDNPYLNSRSPLKNIFGPLGDFTTRNASACSLYSFGSNRNGDCLHVNENSPPLTSQSLLNLIPGNKGCASGANHGLTDAHTAEGGKVCSSPIVCQTAVPSYPCSKKSKGKYNVAGSKSNCSVLPNAMGIDEAKVDASGIFNLYNAIHIPLPKNRSSNATGNASLEDKDIAPVTVPIMTQPFRRWMSILRRRHVQRHKEHMMPNPALALDSGSGSFMMVPSGQPWPPEHRTSESMSSSIDCVKDMKTASITIASASIALRSDNGLYGKPHHGNRSSNYSEARRSLDSHRGILGPVVDESAWLRSLQRRKVVEELISSEESYIADLKVLINDYFTILTALPSLASQTGSSIQQIISHILQLHEDLLAELHRAVPRSDFTKSANQEMYPVTKAKHIRFHSADIIPGRLSEHKVARRLRHSLEIGRSPDRRPRGLVTDTKTVENIAKIFNRHMKRFFTYEEYGAHWTTMSQDLTMMCKGLHGWQEYERGIEALQKIIASENNRDAGKKKALSFPDLLIKPIQRVCKYPLLFDDLCRHTPVYDDPEAHAELEKAHFRLQETIREVNKAKDDPKTRRLIEITWQLQDRLAFQEQKLSRALVFRLLGHVLLCGVLHVAYQTPEQIKGQYMVCVLYKSYLVLASASRFHTPYTVVASISLANGSIEEPDNGRGIQCHTAPHTWKLIFEHGHRLHEIVLSACTSQEEEAWKSQLRERIVCETHEFVEGHFSMQEMFSSLSLDLKSLGPVFGHADSLVRRMSIHRAATLGAKTNLSQIIIKNTQALRLPEQNPTFSPSAVTRSQSHMSSNHVPTLVPRRAERIRLETTLEDVWTKDLLPFPGMSTRRVENQIRASANSVMRKLSMVSITSNFSRRSPSFSSVTKARSEDSFGSRVQKMSNGNLRPGSVKDHRTAPTVVDFHNTPAAFLPTDFELQYKKPSTRHRRLTNRAVGAERSREKITPVKPKKVRRLSTHIINLPRSESSARVTNRATSFESGVIVLNSRNKSTERKRGREHDNQKRKDESNSELQDQCSGAPPSKRFLRNKSKIFKFWM